MKKGKPARAEVQSLLHQGHESRGHAATVEPSETALDSLYQETSSELTGYLRKRFGDGPPDPEDVTHEAFARLAEHTDLSGIKHLRAFLWRIARNLMLDGIRRVDVRSRYDFEIEHLFFALEGLDNSPENVLEVREQLRLVNDVIGNMPDNRRKAFILHRIDGLNFSQIARKLGMTPRAVIKHVGRAALDIKDALKDPKKRNAL
ncbi:MAG: sigma-70 family RNA polymerase sigma factor [Pseudomonadota bacterium]